MTFSNYNNTPEDEEFLREFPEASDLDTSWLSELESDRSCQECKYHDNNPLLPCTVNPLGVYFPDDCSDYSVGE